jgi:gamma-glutamyltranspeptidase/glutathione hydrolase
MSPTFVESRNGVAILGTPGGSRIITMVLLAVLDLAAGGLPESWVSVPRFHHQYLPGAFSARLAESLEVLGHTLKPLDSDYGNMQAVYLDRKTGQVSVASDPRGVGLSTVLPAE